MKMKCNSTYIGSLCSVFIDRSDSFAVWGYCFIYRMGTPRPDNKIKQIHSSHLFLCPITNVSPEDEKQKLKMSNKKFLCFNLLLLFNCFLSYSQTFPQIEGFWGVKLGERESIVVQQVRKSYPSADYDKNLKGNPFKVRDVKLAGIDMLNCEFTFEHGIFTKATFYESIGHKLISTSQVQNYFNSLQPQFQSAYQEICDILSEKYGTPKVSGQTVTWRSSNGNSITVKPWKYTTEHPDTYSYKGQSIATMGIHITYSKGSHLNDF